MKLALFLIGIVLLFGSCVGVTAGYVYGTEFTKTVTIEDFEATKGESGNKYLFSDNRGNTYQVSDCWLRGIFSSTDIYFKVKKLKGKTVTITGYGWRIPFLSQYPNVVKIDGVFSE